jgi:hypothetical protein
MSQKLVSLAQKLVQQSLKLLNLLLDLSMQVASSDQQWDDGKVSRQSIYLKKIRVVADLRTYIEE